MRSVRIGVDTGGTFTDVVAVDEQTGEILTTKTPSTPADPADGFMAGIAKLGELDVTGLVHGTTVATNQLLEDRIEDLGFITTEGFEFILEIARQSVPDGYGNSYFWVKPPRIVPVHRVRTVGGRLDHLGAEVRPFSEEQAVEVARWFLARGITAIGVCFLHSYANPAHEHLMREVLAREHPEAVVSLSSDVLREYREYERSVTTLVDAAVKPTMRRYIDKLSDKLGRSFSVMKSNGGVLSAREVVHQPITTVLSGPAAGALGAALIASTAGHPSVITLDGGGTSTDVAVVVDGEPSITTEGSIGRYPCKIPMIDIVTVGAGGGSIAWISPEGTLKVGPRSAGADPGPLCYGKGGTEVTVTDAHVFLGRIPPHLLGGEIPLDADAARVGVEALADKLGLTPERLAAGILEISAFNQCNAIRQITVKRGLDVRDFPLVTFGGSGPLLACRLIDILGLPAVIVPPDPGNVSAFGLLTVDVKNDYVRTHVTRDLSAEVASDIFAGLERQAAEALDREGFDEHVYARSADLRYYGQAYEVRVPAPAGAIDEAWKAEVVDRFHSAHDKLYGYGYRDSPRHGVEWVNLRVSGIGPITRPTLQRRPSPPPTPSTPKLSTSTPTPGTPTPGTPTPGTPTPGTPTPGTPSAVATPSTGIEPAPAPGHALASPSGAGSVGRGAVEFGATGSASGGSVVSGDGSAVLGEAAPGGVVSDGAEVSVVREESAAGSSGSSGAGLAGGGAVGAGAMRAVFFETAHNDTPIHQRVTLDSGTVLRGPAIVEEYGSTIPIHPGYTATVDDYGNLEIRRDSDS